MLQSMTLDNESLADAWRRNWETLRLSSHSETGYSFEEIDKTRILVAVGDSAARVEKFEFSSSPVTNIGNFIVTWPPGITTADSEVTSAPLIASFRTAAENLSVYDLVRSAVTLIKFAGERCPTVGPIVQIGFAMGVLNEDTQNFRIEGQADELLGLSNDELRLRQISVI
jgi:hypothetical protein